MSAAARVGDTVATGHGCDSVSAIAGPGAPTVLINGTPAARVGDLTVPTYSRCTTFLCSTYITYSWCFISTY